MYLYKTVDLLESGWDDTQEMLNRYGADHWELVNVVFYPGSPVSLFDRIFNSKRYIDEPFMRAFLKKEVHTGAAHYEPVAAPSFWATTFSPG